jgi:outer membrane protein assembly factor BamB
MKRWIFLAAYLASSWGALTRGESTAAETTSGFEGVWLGKVTAPNDSTDIGFAFTPTAKGMFVRFYMPAMGINGANLGPAEIRDGTFTFAGLDTTLSRRDDRLIGRFAIPHLPMELQKVEKWPPAPELPKVPPGPPPKWQVKLGGEIWASPIVRDGTIYVGTSAGNFHARATTDGTERWTWTGSTPIYGTALVTDQRVYVIDAVMDLVCLARADGTLVWRRPLFDSQLAGEPLPTNPTFTHRTPTPVLLGETLYVGSPDGEVYAIATSTGEVRWRHAARTKIFGSAGVSADTLWFGGIDGTVFAFDVNTRQESLRTKLPGAVVSAPVVVGDTVVVGCRDYLLYGLRRSDLTIAWRDSFWFSWVESVPAVAGGIAYIGGSDYARISAFEPATGSALWVTRIYGLSWGTPVVTADAVFAGTHAQQTALIRHEASIVALNRSNGAVRWRIQLPTTSESERSGIVGSLAIDGDTLIAATFDGMLSGYPANVRRSG